MNGNKGVWMVLILPEFGALVTNAAGLWDHWLNIERYV
jgi:hypothetical protein